jgi:hypothetical protein
MRSSPSIDVPCALVRATLVLLALFGVPDSRAHEQDRFTRFLGGGSPRTDCMMLVDVEGVRGRPDGRVARCTDGDIGCDGDGVADGTCTFRVRLCLGEVPAPARCPADVVTGAALASAHPAFAAVGSALAALPMPAPHDTCTAEVEVPLATRAGRVGRAKLRAVARMASGRADRDRQIFVCRPADVPPPATFATIQRTVFQRSCTTASCHGDGAAGGLRLTPDAAYSDLVGVLATNPAAREAALLRVAPGDPDGSFLFAKLTGTLAPGQGLVMPRAGAVLPPRTLELVRRWIIAGAPADAPF